MKWLLILQPPIRLRTRTSRVTANLKEVVIEFGTQLSKLYRDRGDFDLDKVENFFKSCKYATNDGESSE